MKILDIAYKTSIRSLWKETGRRQIGTQRTENWWIPWVFFLPHISFSSVQFSCSVRSNLLWPHETQHARPPCPSPTPRVHLNSWASSRWCIQPFHPCCPLLLLPSVLPSIRVFSNKSALRMRWPKYWSFSFSISPSDEHSGLISFRMDWLYLLAILGTPKSLLQHHSSKASILRCSAFFLGGTES